MEMLFNKDNLNVNNFSDLSSKDASSQRDFLINACIKNNLSLLKIHLQNKESIDSLNDKIPLCIASFYGNNAIVTELILNGSNVNIKDQDWLTPLHWACLGGHSNIVDILIQNGADVNRRDKFWRTPMHCAAINFRSDCFSKVSSKLFKNYSTADRQGWTPLHHACYHGSIEVVKIIIKDKQFLNVCDRKDRRPIHLAAYCGYKNIVVDLIQNGADPNGFTPLHAAACNGHYSICEELIKHNVLINACTKNNNTPLHYATRCNDHNTIEILLKNGADVTLKNNKKQSPIHCLCYGEIILSNLELFMSYGNLDLKDDKGMTPLHIACKKGLIDVVELLLSYNCDINAINNNGNTPLHLVISNNHIHLIDTLLLYYTNKIDLNICNNQGLTALHIAVITTNYPIIKKLLNKKASISIPDNDLNLPIHSLISSPLLKWNNNLQKSNSSLLNYEFFFKLIDPELTLNAKNIYGQTPLHLALMYNLIDCAIILLSQLNADPTICDNNGRNIFHYALIFNIDNEIITNCLLNHPNCFIQDLFYYTPLHYLLQYENINTYLKFEFFSQSIDSKQCLSNVSLIHIICMINYEIEELSELVISYINQKELPIDIFGNTPFHLLANNSIPHPYTLKKLCEYYPNINLNTLFNKNGWSPIHIACNTGNILFIQYITNNYINFKIDCNISTNNNQKYTPIIFSIANPNFKLLKFLIDNGALLEQTDMNGNLPLHYAIISQSYPIINFIIENTNNCFINKPNNNGDTSIILGFKRKIETLVLDKLISSNANLIHFNNENYTALHWLFLRGDVNILKYLYEKINLVDCISKVESYAKQLNFNIFSLLHCIIQSEVIMCLKFVLSIYPNFEITFDSFGRTALHLVFMMCTDKRSFAIELLDYFVQNNINFDLQDSQGFTPLMRALQMTTLFNLPKLCQYSKFDVQEFENKNTPLHLAIFEMEGSNVSYIIDYIEKDVLNIQNIDGDTPLHIAARLEMEDVVEILLNAGADPTILNNIGELAVDMQWDDDDSESD